MFIRKLQSYKAAGNGRATEIRAELRGASTSQGSLVYSCDLTAFALQCAKPYKLLRSIRTTSGVDVVDIEELNGSM